MYQINIDKDKCIACKLCVKDCPELNINIINNKANIISQECMKCGHCVAICPKEAVDIEGFEYSTIKMDEDRSLDAEDLLYAVKSRRSIRNFKKIEVDEEIITKLIEIGEFSPTSKNMQDVEYTIIKGEKLAEIENIGINIFKKLLYFIKIFNKEYRKYHIDNNFFFKNAPVVMLISAKEEINAVIAASNISLLAESYGLGVLYSGFFIKLISISKKIRKILALKSDKKVYASLVIGYPNVKYQRIVQRKKANVKFI